ncbi:MAG: NAD(P)/FAD-dependent oxidoreductase [Streptosporangiaceae bacterium]
MRVAVVGGGIIGLASALELRRAGADVVLFERGRCGSETSLGNMGWVCPFLVQPMPSWDTLRQAAARVGRREQPVGIIPRLDLSFAGWVLRFLRNVTRHRNTDSLRALYELAQDAPVLYSELAASGVEFEMHEDGILVLSPDDGGLRSYLAVAGEMAAMGYGGQARLYQGADLRELEPNLGSYPAAGLHLRAERNVRPETVTQGLAAALGDLGAAVREGTRVTGLHPAGGGWRVATADGGETADAVVVAGGLWSKDLLAPLGVTLLIEPAKGTSLTYEDSGRLIRHPLELADHRVACSTYDGAIRIAGGFELGRFDRSVPDSRVRLLEDAVRTYFPQWPPGRMTDRWAGLRPATPDDLPYIGPVPGRQGLYVAAGHGTLGVTLAPGTARAIRSMVIDGVRSPRLFPFRVDRWGAGPAR